MALGGPGPRDWSPSESDDRRPSGPVAQRPLYAPSPLLAVRPTRRTRPWAFATLAMLLGAGSVVLALGAPQHDGVASGFIVSTIGITAIVSGVHAVRRARWGSATARAFGRGGAVLGAAGSVLMLYGLVAFGLAGVGVTLPALSLGPSGPEWSAPAIAAPTAAPAAPAASTPAASTPAAGPAASTSAAAPAASGAAPVADGGPSTVAVPTDIGQGPVTAEQERSTLVQSAGTLAFTMRQHFGAGPYPAELVQAEAPGRLMLPDGTTLAPVPEGTRVLYSIASDGSAWSVTLVGGSHGSIATYSSTIGTVQAG